MNDKYHHAKKVVNNSSNPPVLVNPQEQPARLTHYVIGFIGSLILTLSAYLITINHAGNRNLLFVLLAILAFIQFIVQLIFFLHVGREFPPRMKLLMTGFMILVVTILVGGSLWIMFSLNSRVMPSQAQMLKYMTSQDQL